MIGVAMSNRNIAIFLMVFVVVYVAISLIDTGSIYWIGLIGSLVGAVLGFVTVSMIQRRRQSDQSG